jgi:outer membrane immunogenic protein
MKKLLLIAGAAAFLGSAPLVFAADMAVKAPPAPVMGLPSWTGFYLGINGGYGWGEDSDWTLGGNLLGTGRTTGGLVGGQIGYNWQMGSLVFGIQGDGDWSRIKGTAHNNITGAPDNRCWGGNSDQTAECTSNIKAMGNLTARIGFLPAPNTLIYGKAGINWSSMDLSVNNVVDLLGGTCGPVGTRAPGYSTNNQLRTGLTAGVGIEQRVYQKVSVFGEYNVVDNGGTSTQRFTGGTGAGGCTPDFAATVSTKPTSIVKVGVNFQFN